MDLNKIENEGKWSEQTTRLNSNFNKINQETESLKSTYKALTQSDVLVVSTLPQQGVANTIYRVVGNGSYSDYMYNSDDLTTPILMATYNNAIDTYPQEGSENLITSGAVYESMQDMLEQSAVRTDTAQDLTDAQKATALGNLGVPETYGEYVENSEWIKVITDKDYKILCGIKSDGSIEWSVGVPTPVIEYIQNKISELSLDEYEDIVAFLGNLIDGDSLATILANIQSDIEDKVDKVEGKSLIDEDYAENVNYVENPEFISVKTDKDGKLLEGITTSGNKQVYTNVEIFKSLEISGNKISNIEDLENRSEVKTDYNNKVVSYRDSKGILHEKSGIETPTISLSEKGIEKFKDDLITNKKYLSIAKNLKRSAINVNTGLPDTYTPAVLLVYSDIHHDTVRNNRVLKFKEKYHNFIDDALLCGDIAAGAWESTFDSDFYNAQGMTGVLKVLGNHDIASSNETPTRQQIYNRYFEGIEAWGVVQPSGAAENGLCYYYKDYKSSKLRLIGLDYSRFNTEQSTWLSDVLADAKTNGLAVICTMHIAMNEDVEFFNTTFNCIDIPKEIGMTQDPEPLNIIDNFIQSGGHFICWIFGHSHSDFIGKYSNHNNQIFIIHGTAMINEGVWEDVARVVGTDTEDSFSLISFDTIKKTISLYRVGTNYDRYMRHKESLTIDYANKTLLGSF